MTSARLPPRLVLLNDISIARGGAAELALASIRAFRARGIAVTLICGDGGINKELQDLGVDLVAIGQRELLEAGMAASFARGLYNQAAATVISSWIRVNDTPQTIYHLHTWSQILSPSVFAACEPIRARLVISAHDYFIVCPNGAYSFFRTGEPCTLKPLSGGCVLAQCDRRNYAHKLWRTARQTVQHTLLRYDGSHPRVLIIHEAMRPVLERSGVPARAIRTLPNPILPWSDVRIPAELNREFLFVGRLNEEKGPDLAAAAARRAGAPLRIIGDGPMMGDLQAKYPEVTFSGRCSKAEIAASVGTARALIMPSRYPEPFGLAAGEALWSGIPTIAAKHALIAPSIVAAGAGLACDPRNEDELAAAITTIATDHDATLRMSQRAFSHTRHIGSTPSAWIDALLAEYDALLGVRERVGDRHFA